jgi:site-specific DNA-methyltransferase (adenine-specific)
MQVGSYPINSITTGDAMVFLRSLPDSSVPMFLFSPPYNLGISSGGGLSQYAGNYAASSGLGKRGGNDKWKSPKLSNGYADHDDAMPPEAYTAWQKELLTECWRALADNGAIYYNHKPRIQNGIVQTPLDFNPGLPVRQIVIWARAGGINYSPTYYCPTHEWIVIYAKPDFRLKSKGASGVGDVWNIPQEAGTWHPAPFPLALAHRAIETVMPAFVVDPFCGSGTTAVAAKQLGAGYLCNELSAEYVAYAEKRLTKTSYRPKMDFILPEQSEMALA